MAALGRQVQHPSLKTVMGYPSLFQPDSDDALSSDSESEKDLLQTQPAHLPINEVIRTAPKTLSMLLDSLLPRLQPSTEVKGVSLPEQKSLMTVLVGELASQFSVIQHQIDDPFLNPLQNKDLHRKVVVRVCEITEELYHQFLSKAADIGNGGVFNASANLSRVRAELTLEANKRLNIPLIRRQVLTQIRGALPGIGRDSPTGCVTRRIKQKRLPPIPKQEIKRRLVKRLSLGDLGLGKPLESKAVGFGVRLQSGAVRRTINKLDARVPRPMSALDTGGRADNFPPLPPRSATSKTADHPHSVSPHTKQLHRVSSVPELWGAFLLCDLGLTSRPDRPVDKSGERALLGLQRPPSVQNFTDFRASERDEDLALDIKHLGDYTAYDLSKDLQLLSQPSKKTEESGVDELDPLLQAHGHGLSVQGRQRLAQYDAAQFVRERGHIIEEPNSPSSPESRIPSVSTLHQLTYLSMDQADDGGDILPSHPSLDMESHPTHSPHHTPLDQSQLLTDFDGSFRGSSLSESGLRMSEITDMLLPGSAERSQFDPCSAVTVNTPPLVVEADSESKQSTPAASASLSAPRLERSEDQERPPLILSPTPQTAVLTTQLQGGTVIRTTDVQVSERTPINELLIKPFGPIYNQLTGDLDSSMIAELDSNLHEGKELREVYAEIMKTLPTTHLDFTHEPMLQPAIDSPVDLSHILASNTLHHRRSRRVINKNLYRPLSHPLGTGETETSKSGNNAAVSIEDFYKFVSRDESDYLRLVYHLYDSEGSDSEEEEEAKLRREQLQERQRKLKAQEARRRQLYSAKSKYEAGLWNVNTILMGGLGQDPEPASDEELESPVSDQDQILSAEKFQERLRVLWQRLHFPKSLQMDMTVKYSNPQQTAPLTNVLDMWEEVAGLIEERETLLSDLESFEREASDPTRFFSKGNRGSSATRLSEARRRDALHKELNTLDKRVSQLVYQLLTKYGDKVTYKGRCYQDKIRYDRTEMLYWLQQQRRAAFLQPATLTLAAQN